MRRRTETLDTPARIIDSYPNGCLREDPALLRSADHGTLSRPVDAIGVGTSAAPWPAEMDGSTTPEPSEL